MDKIQVYTGSRMPFLLELVGKITFMIGLISLINGEATPLIGVIIMIVGLVIAFYSLEVEDNKKLQNVIKQVKELGLEEEIRQSCDSAIELYKVFPRKVTISYIETLNPAAAEQITELVKQAKKKRRKKKD